MYWMSAGWHLVSNAAKFTRPDDTILLSATVTGNQVRISVTDHGPGIPPDRRKDIFQKFTQVTATENQKLPGTGLGLHICEQLIHLHDGTIDFDSVPDQQTVFYFTLPVVAD
jgi:signal transduction histidine kinase